MQINQRTVGSNREQTPFLSRGHDGSDGRVLALAETDAEVGQQDGQPSIADRQ